MIYTKSFNILNWAVILTLTSLTAGAGLITSGLAANSGAGVPPTLTRKTTPTTPVEATLYFRTELGSRGGGRVALGADGQIQVNGRMMPREKMLIYLPLLTGAMSIKSELTGTRCYSGEYFHTVKRAGISKTEKGCLTDQRFSELSAAFSGLNRSI